MSRPKNKEDLIKQANEGLAKLLEMLKQKGAK